MKHSIIIALVFLCSAFTAYSSECNAGENGSAMQLDSCRRYIRYEFGINKFNVYIFEGDTICDVLYNDGKGYSDSTTCKKSPILSWAFDVMANDKAKPMETPNNDYNAIYYKLTLQSGSSQTILSSSSLQISYNDKVKRKIKELQGFIMDLWFSEFYENFAERGKNAR